MDIGDQNIVEVFYTEFSTKLSDRLWLTYLNYLPEDLKDNNRKYKRWQDQHANLLGKLLLILGLQKYDLGKETLHKLQYSNHNRPYIDGKIDFNISHSGHYVLCVVGKGMKIGIDIEEIKFIDFKDYDTVMSREQWEQIRSAEDPLRKFYDYWTIKESIIKADGRGVSIPLKNLRWKDNIAVYEGKSWKIQSIPISNGYVSHLTSNISGLLVNLRKVDFYDEQLIVY